MRLPARATPVTSERLRYAERLGVPWWMWLTGTVLATLVSAEIHLGHSGTRAWLPYALIIPGTLAALWWLGRMRLAVTDNVFYIDDAQLPLDAIADVTPLHGAAKRRALGPELDPLAFVISRPWVAGAARIDLNDPNDPTPYWIVSTRRPKALLTIVAARRKN